MAVPAILHDLIGAGVEFETDGQRIRWRNAGGRVTPDVVEVLRAHKAEVIGFLTGDASSSGQPHKTVTMSDLRLPPHIAAAVREAFTDYWATDDPTDQRAWAWASGWEGNK